MKSVAFFTLLLLFRIDRNVCGPPNTPIRIPNEPFLPQLAHPTDHSSISFDHLSCLPIDCWMNCVEFLINFQEFRCFRILSKRHRQYHDVFLRHQLRKFMDWNGTKILDDEIPAIYTGFGTVCVQRVTEKFDILLKEHRTHRRGILCGINICSGLPFLSLHLRNHDSNHDGYEIPVICEFYDLDNGGFLYWTRHDKSVLSFCNEVFQINDLCGLLRGSTIEVTRRWGTEDLFRIKRQEEYIDYRACKKRGGLIALLILSMLLFYAFFSLFGQ